VRRFLEPSGFASPAPRPLLVSTANASAQGRPETTKTPSRTNSRPASEVGSGMGTGVGNKVLIGHKENSFRLKNRQGRTSRRGCSLKKPRIASWRSPVVGPGPQRQAQNARARPACSCEPPALTLQPTSKGPRPVSVGKSTIQHFQRLRSMRAYDSRPRTTRPTEPAHQNVFQKRADAKFRLAIRLDRTPIVLRLARRATLPLQRLGKAASPTRGSTGSITAWVRPAFKIQPTR